MLKFEFFCRDCGIKFYRDTPDITLCPDVECLGRPLELAATVEWNEAMAGVQGIENWTTNRKALDKKPPK